MVKIFISYSHTDELLRSALEKHLSLLRNQGIVDIWHDRRIEAGQEFADEIDKNLSNAQIVLLLVSADFLASSYCYGIEMASAMKRHESGIAKVIPVILRACDWQSSPFGKLSAAPKDGRPVRSWSDIDEALYDVTQRIRAAAETLRHTPSSATANEQSDDSRPHKAQPTEIAQVYCSRCGVRAGIQSTCTGPNTHHNFITSSEFGAYCSRCGATAGEQTLCTGPSTHHNFVAAKRSPAFCSRCGALAGLCARVLTPIIILLINPAVQLMVQLLPSAPR